MNIIREGNIKSDKAKFKCKKCGCEFECCADEYWTDNLTLTTYPEQHNAFASCPECHKICHSQVLARTKNCYEYYVTADANSNTYVFGVQGDKEDK